MPPLLLQIKNLSVNFSTERGKTNALHGVSLELNRGEIVAMVGESGSGKSVTALSILQLLPASATYADGEILFSQEGEPALDLLRLSSAEMRAIRGNQVAMIFQEPMTSLNPVFTCGDQVMEAIRLHQHVDTQAGRDKTISLFEKVGLPDPDALFHRYPHQLSGGQKQRVMIAMAMSCNPSLLIADEPTTALDVTVQKTILQLIRELQEQFNMGVLFISHDLGVVAEIAHRVIVMYKGKMVEHGKTSEILQFPKHPYTRSLLACRPLLHRHGDRLPVVTDFMEVNADGEMTEKPDGRRTIPSSGSIVQAGNDAIAVQPPATLVQVEGLHVWFVAKKTFSGRPLKYTKAVDDLNFEVYEGETLGLVGESGCGKTTLGRALLRLIEPTKGNILFKGEDLLKCSPHELRRKRREMQIIFQDPYSSLNPRMTIGNAILEPLSIHALYSSEKARKEKVMDLLEKVSLRPEHYDRYPHEFSGGQRQRIVIARALALSPSFIICDESVSSLDLSVQAQVLNLLNDLKKEFNFTAIFISHDLSVVRFMSDRIMVMHKGRIEEIGQAEQIYRHPQTTYTQRLIDAIPKII